MPVVRPRIVSRIAATLIRRGRPPGRRATWLSSRSESCLPRRSPRTSSSRRSRPNSAMDQFNAGESWDHVDGSPIEGGHYVPTVGSVHAPDQATAITGGKRQIFTLAFYEQYNDESWVYITPEELQGNGAGLHGFDLEKLNTYLEALQD